MEKKNILVRGVPILAFRKIKKTAKENMRSINSEIILILSKAAKKR